MKAKLLLLLTLTTTLLALKPSTPVQQGKITYAWTIYNPFPELITEKKWHEKLAENGGSDKFIQEYYFKNENYMYNRIDGINKTSIYYVPKRNMIYNWFEGVKKTTGTDCAYSQDRFEEWIECTETDTIVGIPCQCAILKSHMGTTKVWYNPDVMPLSHTFYPDHNLGNWNKMLEHIGAVPLKYEVDLSLMKYTATATSISTDEISDDQFKLPKGCKFLK